jgi:hypothetical protein
MHRQSQMQDMHKVLGLIMEMRDYSIETYAYILIVSTKTVRERVYLC